MNEINIARLFQSYLLDENDKKLIGRAWKSLSGHVAEFSEQLHGHVLTFEHARAFLENDEALKYHRGKIEYWFAQMFQSACAGEYYDYLSHINRLHKRVGLPPNYINSTFTFIRRYIRNRLNREGEGICIDSVEKLIDINLELLSTHYAGEDFEELLSNIRLFRESLDRGYIEPFAQPIFSAADGSVASYECLCRIDHPERGIIPPAMFLDISRQIEMYHDITRIMFRKTFEFFRGRSEVFSLNLAFSDITDGETGRFIEQMIKEYMPGNRLIIEIVETEELAGNEIIYDFCTKMRSYGVLIAIDDFGSGFSNFNNISKLSPDFIKIDGSLIRDMDENFVNRAAVEGIAATAKKLGIATVAEYVHSESVLGVCRELGISKLQGFFLGKPKRLSEIQSL